MTTVERCVALCLTLLQLQLELALSSGCPLSECSRSDPFHTACSLLTGCDLCSGNKSVYLKQKARIFLSVLEITGSPVKQECVLKAIP